MYLGIIEGYYGKPYTHRQRRILLEELSEMDSPVYFYAPKDDPWHRILWREPYPEEEWRELAGCMGGATSFFFSVSPWQFLDGQWRMASEKLLRAEDSGAAGLGILFDDVPEESAGELARRQLEFAGRALERTGLPVVLCPSVYCTELMERYPGGEEYLEAWRECIPESWSSFWTGPGVVSRELSSLGTAEELLGSPVVVWDNLHATDYCLRRVFLGGLSGRRPRGHSWLVNTSEVFPAALHSVMELRAAAGLPREWPAGLGEPAPGWQLMEEFHHDPWNPGETGGEILARLKEALDGSGAEEAAEWLQGAAADMESFTRDLPVIEGGWQLLPVARDLYRTLSILLRALNSGDPRETLHYLMNERLPYENPLAALAAGFTDRRNP